MSPEMARLREALDKAVNIGDVVEIINSAYVELRDYLHGCTFDGKKPNTKNSNKRGPPEAASGGVKRAKHTDGAGPSSASARSTVVPPPLTQSKKAFAPGGTIPKVHQNPLVDVGIRHLLFEESLRTDSAGHELFSALEFMSGDYGVVDTKVVQIAVAKYFVAAGTDRQKVLELFDYHDVPEPFQRAGFGREA